MYVNAFGMGCWLRIPTSRQARYTTELLLYIPDSATGVSLIATDSRAHSCGICQMIQWYREQMVCLGPQCPPMVDGPDNGALILNNRKNKTVDVYTGKKKYIVHLGRLQVINKLRYVLLEIA